MSNIDGLIERTIELIALASSLSVSSTIRALRNGGYLNKEVDSDLIEIIESQVMDLVKTNLRGIK